MVNGVVNSPAARQIVTTAKNIERIAERTSQRLATGKRVNKALDQPQNFFAASALTDRANDLNRLLDGIGMSVRTIEVADQTTKHLTTLLELAENNVLEAQRALELTGASLPNAILEDSPIAYFRLDDANTSPVAANLGSLANMDNYENGVVGGDEVLFYGAGGLPARFDGVDQYVDVQVDASINLGGPFPERSVELVFNATSVGGRQVIYEEGGSTNSMNIYIDNGRLYVNARTINGTRYGPFNLSAPIQAGETYHVAFTQDGINDRFTGYINGESFGSASMNGAVMGNHPNRNGIGAINQNTYFHDDGPIGNAVARADGSFAFGGEIGDIAIYNSTLTPDDIAERYEATSLSLSESLRLELVQILEQIDPLVEDANYRGINLFDGDNLRTDFSDDRKNHLDTNGTEFTLEGFGLDGVLLQRPSQVQDAIDKIRDAIAAVRDFGQGLASDYSIINTRLDHTQNMINNHLAGADDLTVADINEEGANMLATNVRQQMSYNALAALSQSQRSILQLVGGGGPFG